MLFYHAGMTWHAPYMKKMECNVHGMKLDASCNYVQDDELYENMTWFMQLDVICMCDDILTCMNILSTMATMYIYVIHINDANEYMSTHVWMVQYA